MNSYCYIYVFLLLWIFRSGYSVSLCCSVYCLRVNVYCTTATGRQPNAVNKYNYNIYHTISYHFILKAERFICDFFHKQTDTQVVSCVVCGQYFDTSTIHVLESSWNVMAHGDVREGKWRGNWRMEWVASTLHITSEHGVSSITTADAHTSVANSPLNWRPRRFKWTRPFPRKTKSGFCACAITFQTQSTKVLVHW